MRPPASLARAGALLTACALLASCGGGARLLRHPDGGSSSTTSGSVNASSSDAAARLGFPGTATRNTTRVGGADPVADAAGVALAVYPSASPGTHPTAVTIAPTDSWEASIAASVLMAPPLHAPILLSGSGSLPAATGSALSALAPTGAGSASGAQVIQIGDVPTPGGSLRAARITAAGPFALAAAIDRFRSAAAGTESSDVVVASTADPAEAMPAAGWAAESGDPVLFVTHDAVPRATRQALLAHRHPNIYVLGGPRALGARALRALRRLGTVHRVGAADPAANSVAFAAYRDPACSTGQACAHIPHSFGWALRSPGHGYTLLDADRPLDAAASAALSGSGDYGPQLLTETSSSLSKPVVDYFLNYATPGYTQQGPTVAVYNHGWVIGDSSTISIAAQSQMDDLLQAVPVATR